MSLYEKSIFPRTLKPAFVLEDAVKRQIAFYPGVYTLMAGGGKGKTMNLISLALWAAKPINSAYFNVNEPRGRVMSNEDQIATIDAAIKAGNKLIIADSLMTYLNRIASKKEEPALKGGYFQAYGDELTSLNEKCEDDNIVIMTAINTNRFPANEMSDSVEGKLEIVGATPGAMTKTDRDKREPQAFTIPREFVEAAYKRQGKEPPSSGRSFEAFV